MDLARVLCDTEGAYRAVDILQRRRHIRGRLRRAKTRDVSQQLETIEGLAGVCQVTGLWWLAASFPAINDVKLRRSLAVVVPQTSESNARRSCQLQNTAIGAGAELETGATDAQMGRVMGEIRDMR